jgi:hypothetical protein
MDVARFAVADEAIMNSEVPLVLRLQRFCSLLPPTEPEEFRHLARHGHSQGAWWSCMSLVCGLFWPVAAGALGAGAGVGWVCGQGSLDSSQRGVQEERGTICGLATSHFLCCVCRMMMWSCCGGWRVLITQWARTWRTRLKPRPWLFRRKSESCLLQTLLVV